jgi:glutaredoxin 3
MPIKSNKVIVWGQYNCVYCDRAKSLLKASGIEYQERMIGTDEGSWTLQDLLKVVPTARTVPQIFIGDTYIGGFTELQKYLDDNVKTA